MLFTLASVHSPSGYFPAIFSARAVRYSDSPPGTHLTPDPGNEDRAKNAAINRRISGPCVAHHWIIPGTRVYNRSRAFTSRGESFTGEKARWYRRPVVSLGLERGERGRNSGFQVSKLSSGMAVGITVAWSWCKSAQAERRSGQNLLTRAEKEIDFRRG